MKCTLGSVRDADLKIRWRILGDTVAAGGGTGLYFQPQEAEQWGSKQASAERDDETCRAGSFPLHYFLCGQAAQASVRVRVGGGVGRGAGYVCAYGGQRTSQQTRALEMKFRSSGLAANTQSHPVLLALVCFGRGLM